MSGPLYWILTAALLALTPFSFHFVVSVFFRLPRGLVELEMTGLALLTAILLIARTKILQRVYIFFHEICHWIAVLIFSGTVHEFRSGADLGYVKADRSHFLIRMAPYLLPLFPILVLAVVYTALLVNRRGGFGLELWLHRASIYLFVLAFVTTWFYHAKLLWISTTDIHPRELFLSIAAVALSFFVQAGALSYLAYCDEAVLRAIYFL